MAITPIDSLLKYNPEDDEWLDINELLGNLQRLIGYFYAHDANKAALVVWQAEQTIKHLRVELEKKQYREKNGDNS